jgi:hypothetical protein
MSKRRDQERAKRERRKARQLADLKDIRASARFWKAYMRNRGCDLPFYDFLDSYEDEFNRITTEAMNTYPSLLGIHEVDEPVYRKRDWSALGYGHPIDLTWTNEVGDYDAYNSKANLCGVATIFEGEDGRYRTAIMIRRAVKNKFEHKEFKYVTKIAALCHEIGHVHDIENEINFDLKARTADIIEAEVFANLFALKMMAERQLNMSYRQLFDAFPIAMRNGGYLAEVCRRVLERNPQHELVDWQVVRDENPPTDEELAEFHAMRLAAG